VARSFAIAALILAAAGSLSACSTLPTSGPSERKVDSSAQKAFQIVPVNDDVNRQLKRTEGMRLFSDVFSDQGQSNELLGPGDVVEVSVWEAPPAVLFSAALGVASSVGTNGAASTSNSTASVSGPATLPAQMISGNGTIFVPFVGRVFVVGQTPEDVGAEIARRLDGRANKPQVIVRPITNNTAYVTVVGDVAASARVPLTPHREHLLDALAQAGGTRDPIERISLQLSRGADVCAVPLETIIKDTRQNIFLQPGDVITALFQSNSFTALGASGKSDEIFFEARGISLAQALARAGGLNDLRANAQGVFIFRLESRSAIDLPADVPTTSDGKVAVIYQVDLKDPRTFFVAQNFAMKDKDVLYIANAPAAELAKFLSLLVSTIYPIEGAVTLSK
jgi:polysaccharide export outer membrane protein